MAASKKTPKKRMIPKDRRIDELERRVLALEQILFKHEPVPAEKEQGNA